MSDSDLESAIRTAIAEHTSGAEAGPKALLKAVQASDSRFSDVSIHKFKRILTKTIAKIKEEAEEEEEEAAKPSHSHSHSHSATGGTNGTCTASSKIPVLVLTGYLGAGKTTLLNYILKEQKEKKLAVIENEVGEVSIDDALVEQKHQDMAEELVVLDNGCVCCTIRGDLVKTLHDLSQKQRSGKLQIDGVLLELTGAADPAPVVQSFMVDDECRAAYRIDNVIALVDAKHALAKLDEGGRNANDGTACAQIAFASTVLLNKTDLVEEDCLKATEKRIKEINSVVTIFRCQQAKVDMNKLFNVGAFDLTEILEEQYINEDEFNQFYKPKMDRSITNVGVRCSGPIHMFLLQEFISKYLAEEETAKDFMRIKGVFDIAGQSNMYVIQCVHMLRNEDFTRAWGKDEVRENRIIFIGRGIKERREELTKGFMDCIAKPLRFKVGDEVRANRQEGFVKATIIAQWNECRPYRMRLHDAEKTEVWAPFDDDRFVRAAA